MPGKDIRGVAFVVMVAALSVFSRAQDSYQFTDPNVEDLFRNARMTLGAGVAKVKALELKGRSRVDFNGSLITCRLDIKILLPDHYLRVDATPTDEKLAGFAGKTVINAIRSGPNLSVPPDSLTSAILKNEQWRLVRLLLGAATYVSATVPMIFRSAGMSGFPIDPRVSPKTAASLEGRPQPNAADISGANGFGGRLIFDSTGRMPIRLLYSNSGHEETMTFEDRRDVSGLKLPFHITTMSGGRLVDELLLDQILINPEIAKGDFKR